MGLTQFPNGISSFGIPVMGGGGNAIPITTGTYFFVDDSGSNANDGLDPDHPVATIDYAIGLCTANKYDVIVVMPGHAETISGAGGITADVASVQIIGLGTYDDRPTITMDTAATVSILVTAANVTFQNIVFYADFEDINYCMLITGKGCHIYSCAFEENLDDTHNWVDAINAGATDNDYDGLEIIDCDFRTEDASVVTPIDLLKNSRDVKIIGNRFCGDWDASPYAAVYQATAEIPKNILVKDNLFHNQHDGNGGLCISITATTGTGWVIGNHSGNKVDAGDTAFLVGADGLYAAENYSADVGTQNSGFLYPTADS